MGTSFVLSGGVYLLRRLVAMSGLIVMGLQASEWSERQQLARAALASADRKLGDYQSAERVLRAAIAEPSGSSAGRATLMVYLADLLREQSRGSEAAMVLEEARQLPDLPRAQQTSILVEQAALNRETHQWAVSIEDWNKIGEIAQSEHSLQLEEEYTGGLGETWLAAGNVTRAEPLLRRSLALARSDPNAPSPQIAAALALMANVYITQNKLALAAESLDEAISRDEAILGRSHPQVAVLLELRAAISSRRGEAQPARDDLGRARDILTTHFGAESTAVAGVDAALGDVEQRANRPSVAAAQYGAAMGLLTRAGAEGARFASGLLSRYAAALKAAHRGDEAKAVLAFTRSAATP